MTYHAINKQYKQIIPFFLSSLVTGDYSEKRNNVCISLQENRRPTQL
jgi:hypothetical protein